MEKLKYYEIILDGIDKTGKDLIAKYVFELSGKRYLCYARGILSMMAYNELYSRPFVYDLETEKKKINILLDVDYDDWVIRCKYTNEEKIDYEKNKKCFYNAVKNLVDFGNEVEIISTSEFTPYQIAKMIVKKVHQLNNLEINNENQL